MACSALEGIADGELVTQGFAKTGHVVVTGFARIIGCMNAYSQVETDNKEIQIVSKAYACAQSYGLAKFGYIYLSARLFIVLAYKPNVSGIYKGGAVQVGNNGETVFYVGL